MATRADLETIARDATAKVGRLKRTGVTDAVREARAERAAAAKTLAEEFSVYTLINEEGKTEFLDRAEWEQRMVAWARRNGVIPRAALSASLGPDVPPPATPPEPPVETA